MKSSVYKLIVIILLLLCIVPQTYAAGKGKGTSAKSSTPTTEIPFDSNVEKLPGNFRGNNIITLLSSLAKNASKYYKSEFETNETFQKRLEKLDSTILTGKLRYDSTIAIPLLTSIESTYDADSGTMSVTIPMTSIADSDLQSAISYELPPNEGAYQYSSETVGPHAIEIFTTLSKTKKFNSSNAFGVKIKVTAKLYDTIAVALKNDNNIMKYGGNISLSVQIPSEKAREAKYAGNILLVGELLHPYIGRGSNHTSATIDSPTETLDLIRYVAMRLDEIWFYSIKSGEIFHKEIISYPNEQEPNEQEAAE